MKRFLSMMLCIAMVLSVLPVSVLAAQVDDGTVIESEALENDYTQFVNPFVGTDVDYGQLFPGSVVPYGLMKLSPDTYPHDTLDHCGYDYTKNAIMGFSHTRIEGVGGQGSGGDILVTPAYVQFDQKPSQAARAMNIVKDKVGGKVEDATPGYYTVNLWPKTGLNDAAVENRALGTVKAEMTSDVRTGYHRYTLPIDGEISLTVDMKFAYHPRSRDVVLTVEEQGDRVALSGRFSGANVGGNGKYTMYFYMEINQPALEVNIWNGSTFRNLIPGETITGDDVGAVLTLLGRKDTPLEVKVSVSPISAEQAKRDMRAEMPGWSFEQERQQAKDAWNAVLSKVKVTSSTTSDPDGHLKKLFYTHLYHMFTMPMNATSTDGTYRAINPANEVRVADGYTHYDSWTLWDDFKKYPIIGLVLPDVYADIVRSIADGLESGFATWSHNYQVVPNVRTEHAVALLADGVAKGMTDIPNLAAAYEAAKKISDGVSDTTRRKQVDKMVEYCYDDWAISLLAKVLYAQTGDAQYMTDYEKYTKRAFMYKELYRGDAVNPSQYKDMVGMGEQPVGTEPMGLLWGKEDNGTWRSGNPEVSGSGQGLYQGSLWQYTFWDGNDVSGLMDLMGGKDAMYRQLSFLMGEYAPEDGTRMLHTSINEIDLHSPYLFNFVGRPSRTQYWTRQIYADKSFTEGYANNSRTKDYLYKFRPDGYLLTMDDDAGTMASMYVAAAMGLFPMTPGDPTFQLTSPFFEEMRLDVGNGKEFIIRANNTSPTNKYIQSATLNGAAFERTWLSYDEISRGGVLCYRMGSEPSSWAQSSPPAPSMSDSVDSSVYEKEPLAFTSLSFHEAVANDGSIDTKIAITVRDEAVTLVPATGTELSGAHYTVSNVPGGLTASLTVKDNRTLELILAGKAAKHRISDSIDNLHLVLKDELFSSSMNTKRKTQALKVQFEDDTIAYSSEVVSERADGTFDQIITAAIHGDAAFAGTDGEDFIADGKLVAANLPKGMSLTAVKKDGKTLELRFTGAITGGYTDRDGLILSFADAAFENTDSTRVSGSNFGGMKAIKIISSSMRGSVEILVARNELELLLQSARRLDTSLYAPAGVARLRATMTAAEALLAAEAAELEALRQTHSDLNAAMADLLLVRSAVGRVELETADAMTKALNQDNGGPLKIEGTSDPDENPKTSQVANTFDGAWLRLGALDFGTRKPTAVSIRYSGANNCYTDAHVELRKAGADGELLATIPVPPTGAWGTYKTATVQLNAEAQAKFDGLMDLWVVLKGTRASGQIYVGNFNWIEFGGLARDGYEKLELESYDALTSVNNPANNASLKKEASTDPEENLKTEVVSNTFDGAWLGYQAVNFGAEGPGAVSIRYAGGSDCYSDARAEIRLGGANGYLLATVQIPPTVGGVYATATAKLNADAKAKLQGVQDIYVVLKGTVPEGATTAGSMNWLRFSKVKTHNAAMLEAESYDSWSTAKHPSGNGTLKTEAAGTGGSGNAVANTFDGAWLKFDRLNFGDGVPDTLTINYKAKVGNCPTDARVEVRLGGVDGTLAAVVTIPKPTGSNGSWTGWLKVSSAFTEEQKALLTGAVDDVYVVFRGDMSANKSWYIINLDYMQFEAAPIKTTRTYGRTEAESFDSNSGGSLNIENGTVVHGTYDGAWLKYENCVFDGEGLGEIMLNYSNRSDRMGADAKVLVYLDDKEKESPDLTVALPVNSAGEPYVFTMAGARFDAPVKGTHDLYLVLKAVTDTGHPYVAKLDWIGLVSARSQTYNDLSELLLLLELAKGKQDVQADLQGLFLPLRSALLKARRLVNETVPNEEALAAMLEELTALEKLVVTNLVKSELPRLIQACQALGETNTDGESLAAIKALLPAAQIINADSGFAAYQNAFSALEQSYRERKPVQEKWALNEKLDEARHAMDDLDTYLPASKGNLPAAIINAETILGSDDATAQEIQAALKGLEKAMSKLVPMTNKAGLVTAVALAEEAKTGEEVSGRALAMLDKSLNEAQALLDRSTDTVAPPTNAEYSTAVKALEDAVTFAANGPSDAQFDAFDALVEELWNLDLEGYTQASVDALTAALACVAQLDEMPTAQALSIMMEALTAAKNGLEIDRTELLDAITDAQGALQNAGRYTADSVQALRTALAAAQSVHDDPGATVSQAAAAVQSVRDAIGGLAVYVPPHVPSTGDTTTTITTKQNPDGSITKTVTDKKTGTVTETTTWPDGTKLVTTTKDGVSVSEMTLPKGKDSVTVTIPTKDKPGPGVVAVIVRPDGTREIVKTSVPTGEGLRIILTEGGKLEIVDNSRNFQDVPDWAWFNGAVQFTASRELMAGTSENTFSPGMSMSRAMLMTVLARLDGQNTFNGETWDSVGMSWAKEHGISDGSNPEVSITREQLAAMLYRYAKAGKTEASLTRFSDAAKVSPWASDAIAWAVVNGILTGKPGGLLDPQGLATRAEVSAMLERFISL